MSRACVGAGRQGEPESYRDGPLWASLPVPDPGYVPPSAARDPVVVGAAMKPYFRPINTRAAKRTAPPRRFPRASISLHQPVVPTEAVRFSRGGKGSRAARGPLAPGSPQIGAMRILVTQTRRSNGQLRRCSTDGTFSDSSPVRAAWRKLNHGLFSTRTTSQTTFIGASVEGMEIGILLVAQQGGEAPECEFIQEVQDTVRRKRVSGAERVSGIAPSQRGCGGRPR